MLCSDILYESVGVALFTYLKCLISLRNVISERASE